MAHRALSLLHALSDLRHSGECGHGGLEPSGGAIRSDLAEGEGLGGLGVGGLVFSGWVGVWGVWFGLVGGLGIGWGWGVGFQVGGLVWFSVVGMVWMGLFGG